MNSKEKRYEENREVMSISYTLAINHTLDRVAIKIISRRAVLRRHCSVGLFFF